MRRRGRGKPSQQIAITRPRPVDTGNGTTNKPAVKAPSEKPPAEVLGLPHDIFTYLLPFLGLHALLSLYRTDRAARAATSHFIRHRLTSTRLLEMIANNISQPHLCFAVVTPVVWEKLLWPLVSKSETFKDGYYGRRRETPNDYSGAILQLLFSKDITQALFNGPLLSNLMFYIKNPELSLDVRASLYLTHRVLEQVKAQKDGKNLRNRRARAHYAARPGLGRRQSAMNTTTEAKAPEKNLELERVEARVKQRDKQGEALFFTLRSTKFVDDHHGFSRLPDDMRGADLTNASFESGHYSNMRFDDANLAGAILKRMHGGSFTRTIMADTNPNEPNGFSTLPSTHQRNLLSADLRCTQFHVEPNDKSRTDFHALIGCNLLSCTTTGTFIQPGGGRNITPGLGRDTTPEFADALRLKLVEWISKMSGTVKTLYKPLLTLLSNTPLTPNEIFFINATLKYLVDTRFYLLSPEERATKQYGLITYLRRAPESRVLFAEDSSSALKEPIHTLITELEEPKCILLESDSREALFTSMKTPKDLLDYLAGFLDQPNAFSEVRAEIHRFHLWPFQWQGVDTLNDKHIRCLDALLSDRCYGANKDIILDTDIPLNVRLSLLISKVFSEFNYAHSKLELSNDSRKYGQTYQRGVHDASYQKCITRDKQQFAFVSTILTGTNKELVDRILNSNKNAENKFEKLWATLDKELREAYLDYRLGKRRCYANAKAWTPPHEVDVTKAYLEGVDAPHYYASLKNKERVKEEGPNKAPTVTAQSK